MRNPYEITNSLKMGYEMIWSAAYHHDIEPGYINRYLMYGAETVIL